MQDHGHVSKEYHTAEKKKRLCEFLKGRIKTRNKENRKKTFLDKIQKLTVSIIDFFNVIFGHNLSIFPFHEHCGALL